MLPRTPTTGRNNNSESGAWDREEHPGVKGYGWFFSDNNWTPPPSNAPSHVQETMGPRWLQYSESDLIGAETGAGDYSILLNEFSYAGLGGNSGQQYYYNPDLSRSGRGYNSSLYGLGDFDNNNYLDILEVRLGGTPGSGYTMNIADNQDDLRDGTFDTVYSTSSGQYESVIVGRFNDDDTLDVMLGGSDGNARLLMNGYTAESGYQLIPMDTGVQTGVNPIMHAGDIDQDGDLDLVSVSPGNPVQILWNGGGSEPSFTATSLPGNAYSAAVGDFDNNGMLDIVSGGAGTAVRIAFNQGDTDGDGKTNFLTDQITGFKGAEDFEVADYDGNGLQDILVIGPSSFLSMFLQQNDGTMALEKIPTAKTFFGVPGQQAAAADYDHDGDVDFLQWAVDQLYLYENIGLNSNSVPEFVLAQTIAVPFSLASNPILSILVGDYINEGAVTSCGLPYLGEGLPYTDCI